MPADTHTQTCTNRSCLEEGGDGIAPSPSLLSSKQPSHSSHAREERERERDEEFARITRRSLPLSSRTPTEKELRLNAPTNPFEREREKKEG